MRKNHSNDDDCLYRIAGNRVGKLFCGIWKKRSLTLTQTFDSAGCFEVFNTNRIHRIFGALRLLLRKTIRINIVMTNIDNTASISEAPMPDLYYHKYDRRIGIERRYISYTFHVPERRSRDVRRSYKDLKHCMENKREKDSLNLKWQTPRQCPWLSDLIWTTIPKSSISCF